VSNLSPSFVRQRNPRGVYNSSMVFPQARGSRGQRFRTTAYTTATTGKSLLTRDLIRQHVRVELVFFVYLVRFFSRNLLCTGIRILVVPVVITPTLFSGTKPLAPELLRFSWQIRSRYFGLINDCHRSSSVVYKLLNLFQCSSSVIGRFLASSRGYKRQRRKVMMMMTTTTKANELVLSILF